MKKKDKKWVILCSTAVAAVYATGYFTTESQAAIGQQPVQQIQKYVQTNKSSSSNSLSVNQSQNNGQSQTQTQSQTQAQAQTQSQTNRLYKDGTFLGSGWNRRGTINVKVTIKNDKITDVAISNFAMHYSESDVVGLPDEVLQNQSSQVNNVSGATYSTEAFQNAVQQALDQAKSA